MKNSPALMHPQRSTGGFGLIELMVAMAIGLVITAATLTLYVDMSRSNNELAKTNTQIENGRLAIQLLRDDLMHAGFWNGYIPNFDDMTLTGAPADYPRDIPSPCLAYASWTSQHRENLIGVPVALYADVPSGCSSQLPDKQPNSDVLVVRHVQNCVAGAANCEALTAGKLYWQTSFCEAEARYQLSDAGLTLTRRDCTTTAEIRKFVNNIYYLRNYALDPGDGIPTLMQSSFDLQAGSLVQQPAVAMVEGVEAMRFEFGVDDRSDANQAVSHTQAITWANPQSRSSPTNRGDGAADRSCTSTTCSSAITPACDMDPTKPALCNMVDSVVVKVYLLVRNLEPTPGYVSSQQYTLAGQTYGPFNDNFQRHVYSTTVRLTNVSGRRETP
ncbi:PilW family protein [Pseudomonas sp. CAU 1711]|uniref:PilW family protein n=1 Tax=Pseudomonas sp. CAU 1711 TaxID=3140356 RepID=UPI0032606D2D